MKKKPTNPITKIRTGTGDKGTTYLRHPDLPKSDSLVDFVGDLDEANSAIAMSVTQVQHNGMADDLFTCQRALFDIGAGVHTTDDMTFEKVSVYLSRFVSLMEYQMECIRADNEFVELNGFIYPTCDNATIMFARAVVRRAERSAVKADCGWAVPALNVMSDYLFLVSWYHSDDADQWCGVK